MLLMMKSYEHNVVLFHSLLLLSSIYKDKLKSETI